MIQIERAVLRDFRVALRKSVLHGSRSADPPVVVQAGPHGFVLHAQEGHRALAWHGAASCPQGRVVLPASALADLEGKGEATLEATGHDAVRASWQEANIPRSMTWTIKQSEGVPDVPPRPSQIVVTESGFLKAIADAMQVTAAESTQYGLKCVQLRGTASEIVGTDGRQLLVQSGFRFVWKDDILIDRLPIFGWRPVQDISDVEVGRIDQQVCFAFGPWTLWLPVDTDSRFPNVHKVIPAESAASSRLHLDAGDVDFLAQALESLPKGDEEQAAVTLDLNGQVVVRMRGGDRATELRLSGSEVRGPALQIALNRQHLARALELGLHEAHFTGAEAPVLFQDDRRKYVTVPFAKALIVSASTSDQRIDSPSRASTQSPHRPQRRKQLVKPDVPATTTETKSRSPSGSKGFSQLLEEAQAVQTQLREALGRSHRLLSGLKQYRCQAKAVQATLKQLRNVAA